eukprot:jgi/Astpho2/8738/Aster-05300
MRWQHAQSHDHTGQEDDLGEFRETVRDFAQRSIAPHAAEIDRTNAFPKSENLWTAMGEFGLHGVTVPAEHDGLDMGYQAHCIAMEEISRASGSVGLSYGAHSNLCINQIVRNGTDAQKRKYLPQLLTGRCSVVARSTSIQKCGEHVGALAMSEPGAGSDVVSMRCKAEHRGGAFVLNGTKMW